MAKRLKKKVGTWTANDGPSREELVEAIRTLTAMASCWLDRDPQKRGTDAEQAERLGIVVEELRAAAEAQRAHVRIVIATLLRDEVAVALGAETTIDDAAGDTMTARKLRFPHLPCLLDPQWRLAYPLFWDDDPVVTALRGGFYDYTRFVHGAPQDLSVEDARLLARIARKNLTTHTNIDHTVHVASGPTQAASGIVVKMLRDEPGWITESVSGPSDAPDIAEARFTRWLARHRHPDRPPAPYAVDHGEFFGARRTDVPAQDPRASAAARLVAEVCQDHDKLLAELQPAGGASTGPWSRAALGTVHTVDAADTADDVDE